MKNDFVLLDWITTLTFKQQSALFSSFRGPDSYNCIHIKKITKWIRKSTQSNADLTSNYMLDENLPSIDEIKPEFEFLSLHYCNHLLQGLEIIGYKHPNKEISKCALDYYKKISNRILHLNPETKSQLEIRLK